MLDGVAELEVSCADDVAEQRLAARDGVAELDLRCPRRPNRA